MDRVKKVATSVKLICIISYGIMGRSMPEKWLGLVGTGRKLKPGQCYIVRRVFLLSKPANYVK